MLYTVENSIYTSFTDGLYISFINLFYDFYVFGIIHTLHIYIYRCTSMYYDEQTSKYMFYLIDNYFDLYPPIRFTTFLCVCFIMVLMFLVKMYVCLFCFVFVFP